MARSIVIGSRGSDLALWQAHHIQFRLTELGHDVEIKIIKTRGDKIQHLSFDKMEGKGFFTKELEEALLDGSVDLAVHSHKDLETTYPAGLSIAAVSEREDPSELLLIRPEAFDPTQPYSLKKGAVVGTSSARRKSQMGSLREDVSFKDLRGNVPTRINKLRTQDYDAILLAFAGVSRLDLDLGDLKVMKLDPCDFIPAPAQGVLGLQIREDDLELESILQAIHQEQIEREIGVERKLLNLFQGGCQLPLGAYCRFENGEYHLRAAMAETWDAPVKRVHLSSPNHDGLAEEALEKLKSM